MTRLNPSVIIVITSEIHFGVRSKCANIEKPKNLQLAIWNLWSPLLDSDQFTQLDLKSTFFFRFSSKSFLNSFAGIDFTAGKIIFTMVRTSFIRGRFTQNKHFTFRNNHRPNRYALLHRIHIFANDSKKSLE